jgi:hypothetical protein
VLAGVVVVVGADVVVVGVVCVCVVTVCIVGVEIGAVGTETDDLSPPQAARASAEPIATAAVSDLRSMPGP